MEKLTSLLLMQHLFVDGPLCAGLNPFGFRNFLFRLSMFNCCICFCMEWFYMALSITEGAWEYENTFPVSVSNRQHLKICEDKFYFQNVN